MEVFLKRVMDVGCSAILLCLTLPLFVCIALAVKLSSTGPVLYWDRRVGRYGERFRMPKFRTMYVNADRLKQHLLDQNEMIGPAFKMRNDPRITPIGRFLRRHSLDELPQLWTILSGEMSLVGPRPPLESEYLQYEPWHKQRLSVRPGATCLWQVMGRNAIREFDEWVEMDLKYIRNWSLWLDCKILLRTVGAVLKGTGQ
ncbi:MAG: sugar transferase [Deltaproteobacteria bacterium]|nr:sugar transferase [Deltaproteobacteria bacterium]